MTTNMLIPFQNGTKNLISLQKSASATKLFKTVAPFMSGYKFSEWPVYKLALLNKICIFESFWVGVMKKRRRFPSARH